jgi:thiamine-phosphate pyrophosphorylase
MRGELKRVPFRLLLITDGYDSSTIGRVRSALAALPRAMAAVQLRAKLQPGRELLQAAEQLIEVTAERGAPLLINDRGDVALAAGAAGVHLPASGLPSKQARRWLGEKPLIGVSTHSLAEATVAWQGGADYVSFGPVYPTPSKAAFGEPVGLAALAAVVRALPIPVFALGGVTAERAAECVAAGARLACIGAVLGAADPAAGARALASRLE